jgi:thiol:disulfide interchange protein DsbD
MERHALGTWKLAAMLVLVLTMLVVSLPARAAPIATARLVSEVATIAPGQPFWVALKLTLPAGWHTYWMNPGDSGAPISIAWSLPPGLGAGDISWPAPTRIPAGPLVNFGYKQEAWLLVPMFPSDQLPAGTPIDLQADAEWLVCADICVPERASLALSLAVAERGKAEADPQWKPALDKVRKRLPLAIPGRASFVVSKEALILDITLDDTAPPPASNAWFFPDAPGVIDHAAAQTLRNNDRTMQITLKPDSTAMTPPQRLTGVLVMGDGNGRAYRLAAMPAQLGSSQ